MAPGRFTSLTWNRRRRLQLDRSPFTSIRSAADSCVGLPEHDVLRASFTCREPAAAAGGEPGSGTRSATRPAFARCWS